MPGIDPVTALAISMQAKKGTYALLLGSGISQSAQIPTGWNIVMDLLRQVAAGAKESPQEGLEEWYRDTYEKEPDYSDLLNELGIAQADRASIIAGYIEPSDVEREQGLKQPTIAHRAVASLVAGGHVRVIVTTNFDRLLETALAEIGIVPSVISSADGVNATLPLAHNACTIIKIHGDYTDLRIRNTAAELATYDEELDALLSQVFKEYGLVVSGWSGKWDEALRTSLARTTSPWFGTYWSSYRSPGPHAQGIIDIRRAKVITDMDADSFFQRLVDNLQAIEDLKAPELLSVAIAEASLKRYIDDSTKRIRIHELVVGEATRVQRLVAAPPDGFYLEKPTKESIEDRLKFYEDATSTLRALFVTGCYWGKPEHLLNWVDALDRLDAPTEVSGTFYTEWLGLRYYPALLALYAGGIASVASGRYDTLAALLYRPTRLNQERMKREPLIFGANLYLFDNTLSEIAYGRLKPGYAFVYRVRNEEGLWESLRRYIPSSDLLDAYFDQFEYLFGLALTDLRLEESNSGWAPLGLMAFRDWGRVGTEFLDEVNKTIQAELSNWPPLRAGMFGGSWERLERAKASYDEQIRKRSY